MPVRLWGAKTSLAVGAMAYLNTSGWEPESHPERNAVLEQLERLLTHPAFERSKRSQSLLRYIVEQKLRDPSYHPKERALGIEVFGQQPDYDTSAHPIVRTVASEVRRRIAQYYYEPGHEDEIRLELPLGSYAPEFEWPSALSHEHVSSTEPPVVALPSLAARRRSLGKQWLPYAISICLAAIIIGMVAWSMVRRPSAATQIPSVGPETALAQFWKPVIASSTPIQIGICTWPPSASSVRDASSIATPASLLSNVVAGHKVAVPTAGNMSARRSMPMVGWPDLVAVSSVITFLHGDRKHYQLENARLMQFEDLSRSSVVLLGAFDNPWTIDVTDPLRFHFVSGNHKQWIADKKNPSMQYSRAPGALPGSMQDYAIVARLFDNATGQASVVVAGLGAAGTVAAANFVTNINDMHQLANQLPKGWPSKNIEAVISVETVGLQPGAPRIVGVSAW